MKRVSFDMRVHLPDLARPGDTITIHAGNIPDGMAGGLLIDAFQVEPPDESGKPKVHVVIAVDDDEAWRWANIRIEDCDWESQ
jgi:hypothetical protein